MCCFGREVKLKRAITGSPACASSPKGRMPNAQLSKQLILRPVTKQLASIKQHRHGLQASVRHKPNMPWKNSDLPSACATGEGPNDASKVNT
eukprot:9445214-Pyramimonas_sp.AAC.1